MSSRKNKNKNRPHRPPNPIPLEKTVNPIREISSEDIKTDVKTGGDIKEERVPEIQSEVVTIVSTDNKELEDDVPKKPKRNKHKKRKEEKTENVEKSQLIDESKERDDKPCTEFKNEPLEISFQKAENETGIIPMARKKRNKNKKSCESPTYEQNNNEKPTESVINFGQTIELKSDVTTNNALQTTQSEFLEQEVKPKKKNKRKKDHSDSDKTALLDHENKNKSEVKNVDSKPSILQDFSTSEVVLKDDNILKITSLDEEIIDHELQKKENLLNQESEEQNKRKNKKCDESLKKFDETNTSDIIKIETLSKNVQENSLTIKQTDEKKQKKHNPNEMVMIENTGLQSKLEKPEPIEKRETKKNVQHIILEEIDESKSDVITEKSSKTIDDGKFLTQEEKHRKQKIKKDKKILSMDASKLKKSDAVKDSKNVHQKDIEASSLSETDREQMEDYSNLNLTIQDIDDHKFSKGIQETSASFSTIDEVKDNVPQLSEKTVNENLPEAKEIECKIEDQEIEKTEATFIKPVENKVIEKLDTGIVISTDTFCETRFDNIVSQIKTLPRSEADTVAEVETSGDSETKSFPESTEFLEIPNIEPTKQLNILSDYKPIIYIDLDLGKESCMSNITPDDVLNTEDEKSKPKKVSLEIIEESIVKTEDAISSPSDILPHIIECIRATSEQLLDDNNNNTVIQEVINPEQVLTKYLEQKPHTNDEKSIFFLQSCEASANNFGSKSLEDPTNVKEEPKTDLKSKVIEVSQDLEGLRLSIEKSLAELNILDKNEEPINKKSNTEKEKVTMSEIIQTDEKLGSTEVEKPRVVACDNLVERPICPTRKDHKGKNKSKKKNKDESFTNIPTVSSPISTTESKESTSNDKKEDKTQQKTKESEEKGKQCIVNEENKACNEQKNNDGVQENALADYYSIEKFEDAISSSIDDVNESFDIVTNETENFSESQNSTEIKTFFIGKDEKKDDPKKSNSIVQPKNLLSHPDIPVLSNKTDYKREKNKTPNTKQAKVKIKDSEQIENNCKTNKQSKESQTLDKRMSLNNKAIHESISSVNNGDDEYIYKYSFRKVFLPSACHVCKKKLQQARFICNFCNLVSYCSTKHKEEDITQHQALCFAVSTIMNLKDQKHIYAEAKNIVGHNYRLLRMQMIVSCEKILKRKLVPWEQEVLLYPRICADFMCREWRQDKLKDCDECGQISYCSDEPGHVPKTHHRWCKSFALYQKLVCYQQTKGRLEPKLPSRVMAEKTNISDKINEVLALMYLEKIDLNDMQYATLTQLATAPLTTAYCHQLCSDKVPDMSADKSQKSNFTVHVVGAELQFEADVLNKWEVFFLHLRPDVQQLTVVLISQELNPSNLPLELLGKIRLCEICRQSDRKVVFDFQDKQNYSDYFSSDNFVAPDIVCAFNSSIQRTSVYNGKDPWPSSIKNILKSKMPFVITSYTMDELRRDAVRIQECADVEYTVVSGPKHNGFASLRPDRNFISDDEMPLLFKNYCFMVVCGN